MPGIDPDKDVELTVVNDTLHLRTTRQKKSERKDKGSYRSEFHFGSFSRTLPLPKGCREEDVTASSTDGVLGARCPGRAGSPAHDTTPNAQCCNHRKNPGNSDCNIVPVKMSGSWPYVEHRVLAGPHGAFERRTCRSMEFGRKLCSASDRAGAHALT